MIVFKESYYTRTLNCLDSVLCVFQGEENCLEGCVFVLTGVLESLERDDAKSLIERYGGKVTGNVSRKTTYLVLGRDSGASKSEKVLIFMIFLSMSFKHECRLTIFILNVPF